MSQHLAYDENKFERNVCLKEILNIPDNSDLGYFVKVDLSYRENIRQQTKYFQFCPKNKSTSKDDFNDYMKKIEPKNLTTQKNDL